jgi:cyclopropane-fatty-acyl-phospholipid synthase
MTGNGYDVRDAMRGTVLKRNVEAILAPAAAAVPGSSFAVRFWDGETLSFGNGPRQFEIAFKTRVALRRTLVTGFLGFGEGYMDGDVELDGDLDRLFAVGMTSALAAPRLPLVQALRFVALRLATLDTRRRARRNIAHHYDRGNDFYRLWLDDTMTYSCAYFRSTDMNLEDAQRAKLDLVCRKLGLASGMRLLDVGCGWGSLLIHAARHYGVEAVGCTLSRNQAELARRRAEEAGLGDRIDVRLQDYREIDGRFDRWASIGMFEHVGRRFVDAFVERITRQLRCGGVGLLHFIGKDRIGRGDPWTLTYIFPGGYVPALPEVLRSLGRHDLVTTDVENLRPHYALTLDRWRERFERHAQEIESLYDARFVRMWRLFLASSAAGFRYLDTRVHQIVFTNGVSAEVPLTREDLYVSRSSARFFSQAAP